MAQWRCSVGHALQNHPVGAVVYMLLNSDAVFRQPLHLLSLVLAVASVPLGRAAELVGLLAVILDFVNGTAISRACRQSVKADYLYTGRG